MPPGVAPPSRGTFIPQPNRRQEPLRMAAITVDPLREEALAGLKDAQPLLEALNRLQAETGAALNAGLTVANAFQVVLAEKEVVTPDDWVALTPESPFVDAGTGGNALAIWKGAGGVVRLRELVSNPGAPVDGDLITQLPDGYAPSGTVFLTGMDTLGDPSVVKVQPSGRVEYRNGDASAFLLIGGSWVAADKSLPAWPTSVRLRLTSRLAKSVRLVLVVARSSDSGAGLPAPVVCPAPSIEPPKDTGGYPTLVLPRLDGLQPLTRYTLTFLVLLE